MVVARIAVSAGMTGVEQKLREQPAHGPSAFPVDAGKHPPGRRFSARNVWRLNRR